MRSTQKCGTWLLSLACALLFLGGCTAKTPVSSEDSGSEASASAATVKGDYTVTYAAEDTASEWADADASVLTLSGDGISVSGNGVSVDGSRAVINSSGTYVLRGTLEDGQILVDVSGSGTVLLVLDGANLSCSDSAPLYIQQADKTVLLLADGTANTVTDGESYTFAEGEDEPNAAVFSKDDLTITGGGSLIVNAQYNNGINCKDTLKITGGDISVNAIGNGIKGKDCVAIQGGSIRVTAGHDGIKSSNDTEADKGFVRISGGDITITAEQDGIQAATGLVIEEGTIAVKTGGGSENASSKTDGNWGSWGGRPGMPGMTDAGTDTADSGDSTSAKGLKAAVDITVSGGTLTVDASDDTIHANGTVTIAGGDLHLTSGDDGIHADALLTVSGGTIQIDQSYEGLEGSDIQIDGGTVRLKASDDGLNAAGGNDGSSIDGRPGQNSFASGGNHSITITGGTLYVDAGGDGADSNGSITMTGGTLLVCGPTDSGNGALDYDGTFNMDGGVLVAVGSLGMAQAPSDSSGQYVASLSLSSQSAGTLLHLEDADGNGLLTFAPSKAYQSVIISTPDLEKDGVYTLYTGGSADGNAENGLYTGSYSGGEEVLTFTLSSTVTSASMNGVSSGGIGGPGGMGGHGGMGGPFGR